MFDKFLSMYYDGAEDDDAISFLRYNIGEVPQDMREVIETLIAVYDEGKYLSTRVGHKIREFAIQEIVNYIEREAYKYA